jgi:hypothetical protein
MPDRTPSGPMSKCPVCGRTGLVGKEREIIGARAVTVYKCHGCDNSWRVPDDDRTAVAPFARAAAKPPARKPAGRARGAVSATPPRIVILGIGRAEQYKPHGTEVCISITDPRAGPARLSPAFKDVLRVSFTDITEASGFEGHVLFTPEHARAILDFIDRWTAVDAVVIHCLAGVSRSPAVGMALCELKGWPLGSMEADYPLWNSLVRAVLVQAGRERKTHAPARRARKKTRSARRA